MDELRSILNKISTKNYNNQLAKIKSILDKLEDNFEDTDMLKSSVMIFKIASTNLFYSNLYAKLFSDLYNDYSFIKNPLLETFEQKAIKNKKKKRGMKHLKDKPETDQDRKKKRSLSN